jgi:tripartite-type tricarboxylate transporter receptor subunit TctC
MLPPPRATAGAATNNARRAKQGSAMAANSGWRLAAGVVVVGGAISLAAPACAEDRYPDHTVKVVVPFSAGGGTDVAGRIIAQKLSEAMGQSFVVENRVGASGLMPSEQVARSPADGYTLLVGSQTTLAVALALYRNIQFDPVKDVTGVAMIGVSPLVAVVNAGSPIKSLQDLIAAAKAQNGTMNYASGGVGTTPHMAGALFAFNAGVKLVHVAYRGEAPAVNDALSGQIPFVFSNLSVVKGNIEGGTLRALAVTTAKRVPSLPDVPAIAETLPGFDAATWFVLAAPAGTPHDVVAKINAEVRMIVATPEFRERFDQLGMIPDQDRTPEEIDGYIKSEVAKWAQVIRDAGMKPAD